MAPEIPVVIPTSDVITSADTTASIETPVNLPDQSKTNNPYFIHPSDSPTAVFFSPALQGDNYASWACGISKALNAKGKLGFIDGTLLPPSDPTEWARWKRCDDLVGSWILNSVHDSIRRSCMFSDSAFAIWNDLKLRFSHSNAPKIYQLKSAISALKQENLDVISSYQLSLVFVGQAKCLWRNMTETGQWNFYKASMIDLLLCVVRFY